ncbi:MAG: MgtC/SapB family protein [Candidatus Kapaibacterium sp.]|jgi:putative Mg2+ transporter-C (MgtC) family protein
MILPEVALKLLTAVLVGGLIGIEREYSSKAAGFRSITLICIGSTLFTILSQHLGSNGNADRIAANIITGIGFIGAGVVFKDGFSVTGITTASSIWATAALGMAIGSGDYLTALFGLVLVLAVLLMFEKVQDVIDRIHQVRSYRIAVHGTEDISSSIEAQIKECRLHFEKKRQFKTDDALIFNYDISGKRDRIELFSSLLIANRTVKSFDC